MSLHSDWLNFCFSSGKSGFQAFADLHEGAIWRAKTTFESRGPPGKEGHLVSVSRVTSRRAVFVYNTHCFMEVMPAALFTALLALHTRYDW